MADGRPSLVKSAQRVLEVLEFFDDEHTSASVTDISRSLAYPQSSTSMLLRCLRDLGYLYYNRYDRKYRLTTRSALLGCWAEGGRFRGGRALELVDAIAHRTGETVVLSNASSDYAVHHLHVVPGSKPGAHQIKAGGTEGVLHSVAGELVLSSYPEAQIKLALHRLNAEETDADRRVCVATKIEQLRSMRQQGGWSCGEIDGEPGAGVLAILMPRKKGGDRLVLSIVADRETLVNNQDEFLAIMVEERSRAFPDRDPIEMEHAELNSPAGGSDATDLGEFARQRQAGISERSPALARTAFGGTVLYSDRMVSA